MAIHLEPPSPAASRNQPGQRAGNRPGAEAPCRPYSVLLPVGFAWTVPVAGAAVRSCRTFSPLPAARSALGGLFLWHCPWGRPRRALPGTVLPWSPDFPPPRPFGPCGGGHPADWR